MYQSRIRANKKRGNEKKRELLEPEEYQEYGIAQEMMGNGRIRVFCQDKEVRTGRIRGSMRRYSGKVIIERGDLILFSRREYGDEMVDIFHKYTHDEVGELIRHQMLPEVIIKTLHADFDDGNQSKNKDDYVLFMEHEGPSGEDGDGLEDDAVGSASSSDDLDIDAI